MGKQKHELFFCQKVLITNTLNSIFFYPPDINGTINKNKK